MTTCYLKKVYDLADYVTINISSPNTWIKKFTKKKNLEKLLKQINSERLSLRKKI